MQENGEKRSKVIPRPSPQRSVGSSIYEQSTPSASAGPKAFLNFDAPLTPADIRGWQHCGLQDGKKLISKPRVEVDHNQGKKTLLQAAIERCKIRSDEEKGVYYFY